MKHIHSHDPEPTAEELIERVLYWYMTGILVIVIMMILLEWLLQ
jgi:hypothetical protein